MFLRRFLRLVAPDLERVVSEEELFEAETSCEVVGSKSRTDLVISAQRFTVAVEIKVNAGEQRDQCLHMYLDYKDHPGPRFVFLTPRGRPPTTAVQGAEGKYVTLSFRRVRQALAEVLEEHRDSLVGRIAEDPFSRRDHGVAGIVAVLTYFHTLQQEFP